jgi:hypothetical protein
MRGCWLAPRRRRVRPGALGRAALSLTHSLMTPPTSCTVRRFCLGGDEWSAPVPACMAPLPAHACTCLRPFQPQRPVLEGNKRSPPCLAFYTNRAFSREGAWTARRAVELWAAAQGAPSPAPRLGALARRPSGLSVPRDPFRRGPPCLCVRNHLPAARRHLGRQGCKGEAKGQGRTPRTANGPLRARRAALAASWSDGAAPYPGACHR